MRRFTRLRKRRTTKRRATKPKRPPGYENPAYLKFVRTLYCCAPWCGKKAEVAHHPRKNGGTGLRAPDTDAIPLCHNHHTGDDGWHQSNGFARNWPKEFRQEWEARRVAETQEAYVRHVHRKAGLECPF